MAKRSKLSIVFFVFFAIAAGIGAYLLFQDTDAPAITLSRTGENVSPSLPIVVTATDAVSAVKHLSVVVRFKENVIPIASQDFSDAGQVRQLSFSLAGAGLKDNDTFDLEVTAVDASLGGFGFGNKNKKIYPMRLDSTPPRVSVKSSVPYVRKGGASCVVFSLSKEVTLAGVKAGDLFFPAFRQDNGDYICFFAFPYFTELQEFSPLLLAVDTAGNIQSNELQITRMPRQFKSDSIAVSQGFLDAKAAEFEAMAPGNMSDIERFLKVNGQIRRENAVSLMEIGKNTAPLMLWKGAFLRLPRAASRAGFADHRTYLWEGQKVDEQTHLGFDLASTRQAPVPAANSGNVVYTGYMGIYGNMIIIDHGLGMQSLYSHLSEIAVEVGQEVQKGQNIGKTGATGMAGGDHLHFGILISGLEVTPLEWLDDHWIKDNIVDRIKDAGGIAPEFEVAAPPPPAKQTAPSKGKKSAKRR